MDPSLQLRTCSVDLQQGRVSFHDGRQLGLTPNEVGLLARLAVTPGVAVSRAVLLQDVWGYHPDVKTRAVDSAIKRLRRKIEGNPAEPAHLHTVFGEGYRLDLHIAGPSAVDDVVQRLREHTSFIGRRSELHAISERLAARGGLVTLLGTGGVGKTRLARQLVAEHQAVGLFVDLATETTKAGMLGAVGDALAVVRHADEATASFTERVGRALARRSGIVVLDNLEQIIEPARALIGRWLLAQRDLRLLATSRTPLRLPAEQVVRIGPLPTDDAIQLFIDRARAAGVADVEPSDPSVRDIIERLEGLPLSVELAAARMSLLDTRTLARMLDEPLKALSTPGGSGPARHARLEQAIGWSWDLLDPADQQALAWLSVFVDPPPISLAMNLLAHHPAALDALQHLADQSLLRLERGEPLRVRMLDVVQHFAAQQLEASGEREAAQARHATVVLERAGDVRDVESTWIFTKLTPVVQVRRDLEQVWQRARGRWPDRAAQAALILDAMLSQLGSVSERVERLEEALAPPELHADLAARLSLRLVDLRRRAGQRDRVPELLEGARDRVAQTHDPELEVLLALAEARAYLHDTERAPREIDKARRLAQSLQDDVLLGAVELLSGHVAEAAGDLDGAERGFRRAAEACRRAHDPAGEAVARFNIALGSLHSGRHDQADAEINEAIRISTEAGDSGGGLMRGLLPIIALDRGDTEEAIRLATEVKRYADTHELRDIQAEDRYLLGAALHLHGRLDDARIAYADAVERYRNIGRHAEVGTTRLLTALVELEQGSEGAARRELAAAEHDLQGVRIPDVQGLLAAIHEVLRGGEDFEPLQAQAAQSVSARIFLVAIRRAARSRADTG